MDYTKHQAVLDKNSVYWTIYKTIWMGKNLNLAPMSLQANARQLLMKKRRNQDIDEQPCLTHLDRKCAAKHVRLETERKNAN